MAYIHKDTIFIQLKIPDNINIHKTETQVFKLNLTNKKHIHLINLYIPSRDATSPHHIKEDEDITSCFNHITSLHNTIITGD